MRGKAWLCILQAQKDKSTTADAWRETAQTQKHTLLTGDKCVFVASVHLPSVQQQLCSQLLLWSQSGSGIITSINECLKLSTPWTIDATDKDDKQATCSPGNQSHKFQPLCCRRLKLINTIASRRAPVLSVFQLLSNTAVPQAVTSCHTLASCKLHAAATSLLAASSYSSF